jgi:hypothetical protein
VQVRSAGPKTHGDDLMKGGKAGGKASVKSHGEQMRKGGKASVKSHGEQMRNCGSKLGVSKGKGNGNKPGCGVGSHSALKTKKETTQLNYLAYCASDAGKANFAKRNINTAPGHYSELLELNPPMQFMNESGANKARIAPAPKKKQSKK